MALYCPDPANHHLHVPPAPRPVLLREAIGAEIRAGNYSIRGLARRWGVSRSYVRMLLWNIDPDYMGDFARRHGPQRLTNRDHAGNRARRRPPD